MKISDKVALWLRVILGSFLIIYSLNQFLHFFPTSYGHMPDNARAFIDSVVIYLPALYIFEIFIGIMLILNKWTALILITLFPLSISFLIFNFSNQDMNDMYPAILVSVLNFLLLFRHIDKYQKLLK